jgi:hypothetical protein
MPRYASPTGRNLLLCVLAAGLIAGTLDIVYAIGFWGLKGVPAQRIGQSIAAGVLGKDAFGGGNATAALGLALHYFIATMMAAAYALVARRWPALVARPVRYGLLYGLLLYVLMTYVVVPLSAAPGGGATDTLWIVCSVVAHALLVGLPIALIVRRGFAGGDRAHGPGLAADVR